MNTSYSQRAMDDASKQERYSAILDAAERLLENEVGRLPSVAEVAKEAGLAKGTVYLYFNSKEQLLHGLHARHTESFFLALSDYLITTEQPNVDAMLEITREKMVSTRSYLPLASQCLGAMNHALPDEEKEQFRQRVQQMLQHSGTLLEQHFPILQSGDGAALLMRSYAVIIGLWQLLQPGTACISGSECGLQSPLGSDYSTELRTALRALWDGHIHPPETESTTTSLT